MLSWNYTGLLEGWDFHYRMGRGGGRLVATARKPFNCVNTTAVTRRSSHENPQLNLNLMSPTRTHATQHTVGNLSVPPSQDVQESVEPIISSSSSRRSEITQDRTQSLDSERNIWSLSAMLTDINVVEDVQTCFSLRTRNE